MINKIKEIWCDTQSQFKVVQRRKEEITEDLKEKSGLNSPVGKSIQKFFSFLIEREKSKNDKLYY